MSKIIETKSGTKLVDGIEYNEYPSPLTLIKAMESKWATKLLNEGAIRLNSIEFYQAIEDPELGDANEGQGMLRLNGHPMQIGSINEVFIWCGALPDTSADTLKGLQSSYDTIIRVTDLTEFAKRIVSALAGCGFKCLPHLGRITYNRGDEVSKEILNSQKWNYCGGLDLIVADKDILNDHSFEKERELKRELRPARLHRHWCIECRSSEVCMNGCGPLRRITPGEPAVLNDLFEVCLPCRVRKEAIKRFDRSLPPGSAPFDGAYLN